MLSEVDEAYVLMMHKKLSIRANAVEMNGPAQYMLARELVELGKPVDEVTLGELQAALERVDLRYRSMYSGLGHFNSIQAEMTALLESRGGMEPDQLEE